MEKLILRRNSSMSIARRCNVGTTLWLTVNDKPTTILVVVNNLDVSSVDEKLKRAENRKGRQMTSRPDQDGADLL